MVVGEIRFVFLSGKMGKCALDHSSGQRSIGREFSAAGKFEKTGRIAQRRESQRGEAETRCRQHSRRYCW